MNNETSVNNEIFTLQNLLENGNFDSGAMGTIQMTIWQKKEAAVLKIHPNKICGPYKNRDKQIYKTRCPWIKGKKDNQVVRSSYEDMIEFLYDHYYGYAISQSMRTVREVYEDMVREYEELGILKPMTLLHYKNEWKKYIGGEGNLMAFKQLDAPIASVKASQLLMHYRYLCASNRMQASTFYNVKTVVNAVFDYAINEDIPCIKASQVSTRTLTFAAKNDKWDGVYSDVERRKILNYCSTLEKPTVYTKAIELIFCLDIRVGELRALQWDDIDLENKKVKIAHQMVDRPSETAHRHAVRSNIMKGAREAGKRVQPLSSHAIGVLNWLLENNGGNEWVLPNKGGNDPITTNRINDNLKRICNKLGIKYYSSHGARFYAISAMYDAGVPEKEIQRMSGHTTPTMTQHYNKKIASFELEEDKLEAIFG